MVPMKPSPRILALAAAALAALVVLLVGVTWDPAPGTPAPTPGSTPTPTEAAAATPEPAAPTGPTPGPTDAEPTDAPDPSLPPVAADPPPLAVVEVASGLSSPISITGTPGGWLLVNERGGRVVAVDPESGERTEAVDLRDRVRGEGERGLLGLALHPDWPEVRRAFVHYTDRAGDTVVSELAAASTDEPPRLDPGSEQVLLRVAQPFGNHNGGQIAFGPDGHLWIALGDGGSGGDPQGHGQNPDTLLGAILRIDVSEPGRYAIPADNAFADGGGAPEVQLWGLRNPWRFSFDRAAGTLWIADVGQNAWEEVNRLDPAVDAGANLGWNTMEATHCYADAGCSSEGLTLPVSEYGHDRGCSVTGGYVYRGSAVEGLAGWYLFSDYCSGTLFGIPSDAAGLTDPRSLLEMDIRASTFGEDAGGELYVADIERGSIYRIVGDG
jgi:glucose/arabinose dehydrogenase